MPLAAIDWTQIIVALIASLPAIIAALAALSVRRSVSTPSSRPIGAQVESALHVGIGNAHRLEAIRKVTGSDPPANPELEPDAEAELPQHSDQ